VWGEGVGLPGSGVAMMVNRQLKKWLNQSRTYPVRFLATAVPYRHAAPALLWLAKRHGLFRRQTGIIRRACRELQLSTDPAPLVTHSLAANTLRFYRMAALARCDPQQLARWLVVEGLDNLEQALAAGQGVIVINSHTSLAHMLTLVLHRAGFAGLHTVGDDSMKLQLLGVEAETAQGDTATSKESGFLQQLQAARVILGKGGLVQIAADGSYGSSGIDAEFFGRKRFFRSGFAELAAATQAAIIPALVTLQPEGIVRVTIRQPLERNSGRQPHRQLVADLMQQYIVLNRQIWREHPGDLKWRQLERFLELPCWRDGGAG
jgi:lauroyl/myristoyl acyltransferase